MPFFMNTSQLHDYFKSTSGVVTDSRKLKKDCFFVALKGPNFDGNLFAESALEQGAKYALIDQKKIALNNDRLILVDDVLKALQELSIYHRNRLKLKILALTGSNGKTTTKELIRSVLDQKYTTKATEGNLNNHIGVPLTLLQFDVNTEIGIVEMGANHKKEIDFLCHIAQPDYGLITNFGEAHLEGFGGIEGVIEGKSELYDYISKKRGTLFLNYDDPLQKKWTSKSPHYTFGQDQEADCPLEYISKKNRPLTLKNGSNQIESQLHGEYNFPNIAAAVAIGKYFDLADEQINRGISGYEPRNNRSQIILKGKNKITLDAYNANPTSMEASLTSFVNNKGNKAAVILGDMFELGVHTPEAHQKIVNLLEQTDLDKILIAGKHFFQTHSQDMRIISFESLAEIKDYLIQNPFDDMEVLIKGSRGMMMESLLEYL